MRGEALRRRVRTVALAAIVAVAVTGCGGDETRFDRAFIDAMVPHHEQAIAMAREAKDAGLADPELLRIADAVITTQQDEIDRMRAWREEWYGSSAIDPDGADALEMSVAEMGMEHATGEIASADDVDAAFAAAMIAHHEGAIAMASRALDEADHDEIRSLAEDIVTAQEAEVEALTPHADPAMHHGG